PTNAAFAVSNGFVEVLRRSYQNNTGHDFTSGSYAYRDVAVAWDTYHYQTNESNPAVLEFDGSGKIQVNYPCIVVANQILTGQIHKGANIVAVGAAISHSDLPDEI